MEKTALLNLTLYLNQYPKQVLLIGEFRILMRIRLTTEKVALLAYTSLLCPISTLPVHVLNSGEDLNSGNKKDYYIETIASLAYVLHSIPILHPEQVPFVGEDMNSRYVCVVGRACQGGIRPLWISC